MQIDGELMQGNHKALICRFLLLFLVYSKELQVVFQKGILIEGIVL